MTPNAFYRSIMLLNCKYFKINDLENKCFHGILQPPLTNRNVNGTQNNFIISATVLFVTQKGLQFIAYFVSRLFYPFFRAILSCNAETSGTHSIIQNLEAYKFYLRHIIHTYTYIYTQLLLPHIFLDFALFITYHQRTEIKAVFRHIKGVPRRGGKTSVARSKGHPEVVDTVLVIMTLIVLILHHKWILLRSTKLGSVLQNIYKLTLT